MNQHDNTSWMMPSSAFEWIEANIPAGTMILEFGSGKGSDRISKNYTLYSVEHDPQWISVHDTNYIYAPITLYTETSNSRGIGWYDADIVNANLPSGDFSLIIIDGPTGAIGRWGILDHLYILERSKYVLIDDLHRPNEYQLSQEIAEKCGLRCLHLGKCLTNGIERKFGVFERV